MSTSSAEATPDSTRAIASIASAVINRVVTNPATSRFTTTTVLPTPSAKSRARASVSSLVLYPRTSSTSFMSGTGEKKWVPTTISGRSVTAAIVVIGMAEVFVANTVSSAQMASRRRKTSALISSFSKTASTTISASPTASRSVVVVIRASASCASCSDSRPFCANLSNEAAMASLPRVNDS